MKIKLRALFTALIISLGLFNLTSCAASAISIVIDGREMQLDDPPRIVDGRTLIPVRAMFESFGMSVDWEGSTLTVHASNADDSISMTVGENKFYKNTSPISLDVPAAVYDDRVFVPVRAISEALECHVNWDADSQTVYIISDTGLNVHFINVGQADSALITCEGQNMLIDGGNADDSQLLISYLNDYNVKNLDYIIATHAHEDHIGGLPAPLQNLDISRVFAPETGADTDVYRKFTDAVVQRGLTIEHPSIGDTLPLGSAELTFLGPLEESPENLNNTSIVCRITYGENSFLFTGDMEYDAEKELTERNYPLNSDVLKVGHHGSSSSSSYTFLREVMPEYAVISVGKNNTYGHPTEKVLSRLRDVNAEIYRTDLQGHIVMHSDGESITVTAQKNQNIETNPTKASKNNNFADYMYIGNKRTKKYHIPACSSLPAETNRVYFSSLEEVLSAGYTPCSSCLK